MILGLFSLIIVSSEPISFLESPDSHSMFLESIDKILDKFSSQEETAQKLNTALESFCEESLSAYDSEVKSSELAVQILEDSLNRDTPQLGSLQKEVDFKEKELLDLQVELEKSQKQRQAQHDLWESQDLQLSHSLQAVTGSSKAIAQLKYTEAESVESSLDSYKADVLLALKSTGNDQYEPTILSLAEIVNTGNQDSIDECINILEHLKHEILINKEKNTQLETEAQSAFAKYQANLHGKIQGSEQEITGLKVKLTKTQTAVEMNTEILDHENGSLDTAGLLRDSQMDLCTEWKELYQRKNKDREDLKATLKKIVSLAK